MCSRQCHPQRREPRPSVYHSKTVQRYSLFIASGRLHLWTSSWFDWHSPCHFGGSLSGCSMLIHSPQVSKSQCGTRASLHSSLRSLPFGQKEFLVPSMAFSTANAFDIVCRLDRDDTLDEVPHNKKQKVTTGLLLDKQDFAWPLACRSSRDLGPISRHRIADILLHEKCLACFSSGVTRWLPSHPL